MRGVERATLVSLALSVACRREVDAGARTPREALTEFVRCTYDRLDARATAAQIEAATRLALRRERAAFAVRAGRCEDALRVGGAVPSCLAPLRMRWGAMLPVAQRPGVDAIDLDVAVRRVGEAYSLAQRCP